MTASESTDSNKNSNRRSLDDSVWYKSTRLTINLLIHVLMTVTIFVCVVFVWEFGISFYTMHIVLCVLGFQFFMFQGTLVMSKYNVWSVYITRRHRRYIHIGMQVVGAVLAAVGTYLIVVIREIHFRTMHGMTGLLALVFCILSLLNGYLVQYPWKLRTWIGMFWIKFFHYVTGIASMFLATGSLVAAFKYEFFIEWLGLNHAITVLVIISWLFTVLVSIEFWVVTANRIRNIGQ